MTIDDFITGEKFYQAADLIYSPDTNEIDYNKQVNTFDESKLKPLTVVYFHTLYKDLFFERIKNLPNKFIIISHNSDVNVKSVDNVPSNVVHWFSQNVCIKDPRLSSLPIGLENKRWHQEVQKKNRMLAKVKTAKRLKNLVYVNHNISTNPAERTPPYDVLKGKPFATTTYGYNPQNFDVYIDEVYNHKFVVSPPGNGVDTHRKWETLYLGSIPIEKRCPNNTFYEDLPICFVDSWDQVTESFLNSEYERIIHNKWNLDKLRMSYWLTQIAQFRRR